MDKIYIRDILVRCIIGINEDERREKQDVVINITLHADLRKAGETDNIADTIDYKSIKKRVISIVENSQYFLVEAMADKIARACLESDNRIAQADVLVEKPGALRFARTVGVEISRTRCN